MPLTRVMKKYTTYINRKRLCRAILEIRTNRCRLLKPDKNISDQIQTQSHVTIISNYQINQMNADLIHKVIFCCRKDTKGQLCKVFYDVLHPLLFTPGRKRSLWVPTHLWLIRANVAAGAQGGDVINKRKSLVFFLQRSLSHIDLPKIYI